MTGTNPNLTLTTFMISKRANAIARVTFKLTVLPKLEREMCFVSLNMFYALMHRRGRIAHTLTLDFILLTNFFCLFFNLRLQLLISIFRTFVIKVATKLM